MKNGRNYLLTPDQEIIRNQSKSFLQFNAQTEITYGNFFPFADLPEFQKDLEVQRRISNQVFEKNQTTQFELNQSHSEDELSNDFPDLSNDEETLNSKEKQSNEKDDFSFSNFFQLNVDGKIKSSLQNESNNPYQTKNLLSPSGSQKMPTIIVTSLDSPTNSITKEINYAEIRPKPFNYRDYNQSVFKTPPNSILKSIEITKAQIKHPELLRDERPDSVLFCEICQVFFSTPEEAEEHKNSEAHLENLNKYDCDQMLNDINEFCQQIDIERERKAQLKQAKKEQKLLEQSEDKEANENENNFLKNLQLFNERNKERLQNEKAKAMGKSSLNIDKQTQKNLENENVIETEQISNQEAPIKPIQIPVYEQMSAFKISKYQYELSHHKQINNTETNRHICFSLPQEQIPNSITFIYDENGNTKPTKQTQPQNNKRRRKKKDNSNPVQSEQNNESPNSITNKQKGRPKKNAPNQIPIVSQQTIQNQILLLSQVNNQNQIPIISQQNIQNQILLLSQVNNQNQIPIVSQQNEIEPLESMKLNENKQEETNAEIEGTIPVPPDDHLEVFSESIETNQNQQEKTQRIASTAPPTPVKSPIFSQLPSYAPLTPRIRHKCLNHDGKDPKEVLGSTNLLSPQHQVDNYIKQSRMMHESMKEFSPFQSESMLTSEADTVSESLHIDDNDVNSIRSEQTFNDSFANCSSIISVDAHFNEEDEQWKSTSTSFFSNINENSSPVTKPSKPKSKKRRR